MDKPSAGRHRRVSGWQEKRSRPTIGFSTATYHVPPPSPLTTYCRQHVCPGVCAAVVNRQLAAVNARCGYHTVTGAGTTHDAADCQRVLHPRHAADDCQQCVLYGTRPYHPGTAATIYRSTNAAGGGADAGVGKEFCVKHVRTRAHVPPPGAFFTPSNPGIARTFTTTVTPTIGTAAASPTAGIGTT